MPEETGNGVGERMLNLLIVLKRFVVFVKGVDIITVFGAKPVVKEADQDYIVDFKLPFKVLKFYVSLLKLRTIITRIGTLI